MRAGRLNRKVAIEQRAGTRDAAGQPVDSWALVDYLWVDIAHDTGKAAIRQASDQVPTPYQQYSLMARFVDVQALGITSAMRVTFDGDHFDIKGITRDLKNRDAAYLICELGGNDG